MGQRSPTGWPNVLKNDGFCEKTYFFVPDFSLVRRGCVDSRHASLGKGWSHRIQYRKSALKPFFLVEDTTYR